MFEIRPSQKKDFPKLMELNNLIWNQENTPHPVHWKSVTDYERYHPEGSQYAGILDDEIAGFVQPVRQPAINVFSQRNLLEIVIGVHPRFHGKKVGTRLIDFISNLALEENRKKLFIKVLSTNTAAIAFYKHCGFTEQGRVKNKFFLNGLFVDDVFMVKELNKL